jgi:signal transduction histidine kinase
LLPYLLRQKLGRTQIKLPNSAPESAAFRGQREDLDEMLGNLLDNACKWARAQVRLTCSKEGE